MSGAKGVLPMPVWVVIGAAVGAAVGSGGGDSATGLWAGMILGGAGGALVSFGLSRRRGD
ncbi:MAG TPA: hypothetical protein VJM84_05060 [Actinomycetota bacterium]|nr:hypothetical protein [Actinomycetota bacterium]